MHDKPVGYLDSSSDKIEMLSERSGLEHASNYRYPTSLGDSHLLEKMVQAFLSCVTTGNVKVSFPIALILG